MASFSESTKFELSANVWSITYWPKRISATSIKKSHVSDQKHFDFLL